MTCPPGPFVVFACEDCAVCNNNFVKGPGFACTKCSENVWGILAAVVCSILAVVMTVLAVKYVISANMGVGRGFFSRMLRRVPLQSVKIIIVAWQILTQVSFEMWS